MNAFYADEVTHGYFGPLNDSQFVKMFNQMEDAGSFYKLLDDIHQWTVSCFSVYALIIRLKEGLGIDVDSLHRPALQALDDAQSNFVTQIHRLVFQYSLYFERNLTYILDQFTADPWTKQSLVF